MRFMILLKADKNTEAGVPPSTELIAAMMKYNEELTKAGVLLAGGGLQPSSKGDAHQIFRWRTDRHRRSVPRAQRTDRRVLDLPR